MCIRDSYEAEREMANMLFNKENNIGSYMVNGRSQPVSYTHLALATGNPYIKEKMDLDIQVSKLKLLKANHTSQKYRLEDNISKHYPIQIAAMKERLAGYRCLLYTSRCV